MSEKHAGPSRPPEQQYYARGPSTGHRGNGGSGQQDATMRGLYKRPVKKPSTGEVAQSLVNGSSLPAKKGGAGRRGGWGEEEQGAPQGGDGFSRTPPNGRRPQQQHLLSNEDFRAAVKLNSRISSTRSAAEVLDIVEECMGSFNSVNAATAFHRLARVRKLLASLCCPCLASEEPGPVG